MSASKMHVRGHRAAMRVGWTITCDDCEHFSAWRREHWQALVKVRLHALNRHGVRI